MAHIQSIIDSFLQKNNINLLVKYIDNNIIFISNENNDMFYHIFIRKYINNIDIDVIRNVVRHDDSIVSHKEESINISHTKLIDELQIYNIINNDKLNKLCEFISFEIF